MKYLSFGLLILGLGCENNQLRGQWLVLLRIRRLPVAIDNLRDAARLCVFVESRYHAAGSEVNAILKRTF